MRRPNPTRLLRRNLLVPVLVLCLAGCGRSAPQDAVADTNGDPEIAGVAITSPDAVVSTVPGADTTPPPSTTAVPAPAAPVTVATYTIQPGDTLSKIAGDFGITIRALADANAISDVNSIKPGQQLSIPAAAVEAPAPEPGPGPGQGGGEGDGGGTVIIQPEIVDPATTSSLLQP